MIFSIVTGTYTGFQCYFSIIEIWLVLLIFWFYFNYLTFNKKQMRCLLREYSELTLNMLPNIIISCFIIIISVLVAYILNSNGILMVIYALTCLVPNVFEINVLVKLSQYVCRITFLCNAIYLSITATTWLLTDVAWLILLSEWLVKYTDSLNAYPLMIIASRVVSPRSSGLPPNPTLPSHCSSSHCAQPRSTASRTEPPFCSVLQATDRNHTDLKYSHSSELIHGKDMASLSPALAAFLKFQVLITKGSAAWFRGSKQIMTNTIWIIFNTQWIYPTCLSKYIIRIID